MTFIWTQMQGISAPIIVIKRLLSQRENKIEKAKSM